jgi:hypothetical protein
MRLLLLLTLLGLGSCAAVEPGLEKKPVRLLDPKLTEASGLAMSRHDSKLLWLINDSGSAATILLADTQGAARGFLNLRGVKNTDWEDLAVFTLKGKPYLLIADTGDNGARRDQVVLHFIAEPKSTSQDSPLELSLNPDWSIRFRYEDGSRDCEGVAVDSQNQSILLVTKRDKTPSIYQIPLRKPVKGEVLTAKRLGPLAKLADPKGSMFHPYANQPTALDISADGRMAAVLTYRGVYLFRRTANESWTEAFAKDPETLGAHGLPQAEALAFSTDGRKLYVTSEGRKPRLVVMAVGSF